MNKTKNNVIKMKKSKKNEAINLEKLNSSNYNEISIQRAARIAGSSLLIMFFLALIFILVILSNIIIPADAATTVKNIKANELLFGIAIFGYFIILGLDVVVALALYIVLKTANKNLALLQAVLRLLYTTIMVISLIALIFLFVDVYSYGELFAYIFFISHLFILGCLVYKSGYIPRVLALFLIIGSFGYVISLYGSYFLPK